MMPGLIQPGMILCAKDEPSRLALALREQGGLQPQAITLCGLVDTERALIDFAEQEVRVYSTRFLAQLWNTHTVHADTVEYTGIRVDDMTKVWATDGEVGEQGPATAEMMKRARYPWSLLAQEYAASIYQNVEPPSRIVVAGGAACVWDDLAAIPDGWADCWIACNQIGTELPRLDHWVTFHPEHFPKWEKQRVRNGHPADYVKWGRTYPYGVTPPAGIDQYIEGWTGSSGLLATQVALKLRAPGAEIVLCGIPMDNRTHYYNERAWSAHESYRAAWVENARRLRSVRSMRGWTRELLGAPWFAE